MKKLVALVDSDDGLYHQGDVVELVQDCDYTLSVMLRGHSYCVVASHFGELATEAGVLVAYINNKDVEADSLGDLRRVAREQSTERWIYGRDDQGDFGFCNDPDCGCDGFMRYN